MNHIKLKRNIQAYIVGQLAWLGLVIPIIVPIWQANGLSFSKILLLQGIFGLLLLIMEFPSGVLADYMKRNHLIGSGYLALSLGTLAYSVSDSFTDFVIAEAFFAFGFAARSGANSASLWDACLEANEEEKAKSLIASGKTIMMGSAVVFTIVGGIMGAYSLYLPFYVAAVGALISALIYLRAPEPNRLRMESASATWKQAVKFMSQSRIIEVLMLNLILFVGLRIVFWAYIPKLQNYNVEPIWFGFVLAGANLVGAVVSLYVKKNPNMMDKEVALVVILAWIGIFLFVVDTLLSVVLIAIALHQVGRGVIGTLVTIRVNESASSEVRASVISLLNSMTLGVYLSVSVIVDWVGLGLTQVMILNTIFSLGIFTYWSWSKLRQINLDKVKPADPISMPIPME